MRDKGPGTPMVRHINDDGMPRAWITYRRKDGTGAHRGTLAINPEYVRVHHEWLWLDVPMPPDTASSQSAASHAEEKK